ncbi:zf-HC2 domain-containing protein [Stigmatella sp. ncwal1]|uniref:Zf-HC2 domain-containing protein n=1 Tax=Stigmatella ashevillensis TaxID=2995309 RepID=A0ABT5D582_9BACT|nr:zf-HC2 domain-containing protein [Stigmatella ashevillena]MDC0708817.1 zf-HC2 domain-containing protein [Stigmatella ashevillena]
MKPQHLHAPEDRLLDFAYGELSAKEALAVESHLEGCPRCREALASIRGVRSAFSQLSLEPAPEAGLDSLLAYAQQSARSMAAGPVPKQTLWRRLTVPVMGVAAVCVFGMVTLRVTQNVQFQPEFSAKAQEAAAPKPSMDRGAVPPASSAETATIEPGFEPNADLEFDTQSPSKQQMPQLSTARRDQPWEGAEKKKTMPAPAGKKGTSLASKSKEAKYEAPGDKVSGLVDGFMAPPPPPAPVAPAPAAATPAPRKAQAEVADELEPAPQQRDSDEEDANRLKDDSLVGGGPSSSLRLNESRARQSNSAPSSGAVAPAERPVSETELSQQVIVARQDNKRVLEVSLLREALAAGATGEERLSLLTRLCDAEFALGRRKAAIEACSQVVKEAPGSQAAQVARRRLNQDAPAAKPQAQPGSLPASPPAHAP